MHAKSLQSCPTLCDSLDHSPPGSSVHGILQARILECVAMPSSRGSSRSRDGTCVSCIGRWTLYYLGFPGGSDGKESACNKGDLGSIPGWEDPLEKKMETHSGILAWRIPWTEEPVGLQSTGSQRVGHD